jgi:hypothetical protein
MNPLNDQFLQDQPSDSALRDGIRDGFTAVLPGYDRRFAATR